LMISVVFSWELKTKKERDLRVSTRLGSDRTSKGLEGRGGVFGIGGLGNSMNNTVHLHYLHPAVPS
jgi:hypothetical protein